MANLSKLRMLTCLFDAQNVLTYDERTGKTGFKALKNNDFAR